MLPALNLKPDMLSVAMVLDVEPGLETIRNLAKDMQKRRMATVSYDGEPVDLITVGYDPGSEDRVADTTESTTGRDWTIYDPNEPPGGAGPGRYVVARGTHFWLYYDTQVDKVISKLLIEIKATPRFARTQSLDAAKVKLRFQMWMCDPLPTTAWWPFYHSSDEESDASDASDDASDDASVASDDTALDATTGACSEKGKHWMCFREGNREIERKFFRMPKLKFKHKGSNITVFIGNSRYILRLSVADALIATKRLLRDIERLDEEERNASMFYFLHQEVPELIELQPTRSWGFFRFSDAVNHALYMKLRRLATPGTAEYKKAARQLKELRVYEREYDKILKLTYTDPESGRRMVFNERAIMGIASQLRDLLGVVPPPQPVLRPSPLRPAAFEYDKIGLAENELDARFEIDATMEPDLIATGKRRRRRPTLRERIGKLKRAKGRIHYQLFYYGYQVGSSMKTLGKLQDKRNDQTRVQIGKLEAVGNELRVTLTHRLNRFSDTPLEELETPYQNGSTVEKFFVSTYLGAMRSLGFFAKPRSKPFHYAAVRYVEV